MLIELPDDLYVLGRQVDDTYSYLLAGFGNINTFLNVVDTSFAKTDYEDVTRVESSTHTQHIHNTYIC